MRRGLWLGLLLLGALASAARAEVTLWVAPGGDDRNPGTKERPLATLAGAREAVRGLRQAGELPGPVTVTVRAGTYYLGAPLTLGPEDSGTEQCPITWRAAEGEAVTLSGGRVISGWKQGAGKIWTAHLPDVAAGKWDFRELFVNGKRQILARYPNFDPAEPYEGGWLFARTPAGWKGDFGRGVHNTQVAGTWMEYNLNVPATGHYYVWLRDAYVAAVNQQFHHISDMSGATELSVDGGPGVPLLHLPDTGGWEAFQWSTAASAELDLTAGPHVLRWTNVKSGGINPDAWVSTDDPAWRPALPLPATAQGRHLFVVQAERPDKWNGPLLQFENYVASDDTIYTDPGVVKPAWNAPGAVVHIFPYNSWFSMTIPIEQADPAGNRIVLADKADGQVLAGNRYFVENVKEELDSPGEWYLDRAKGDLYYWPSDPAFPQVTVTAPVMDRLIVLAGTADKPVRHVNLQGFTIRDVDYGDQQDPYYPAQAAIQLREASDCRVEGCNFLSVGGYAVWIKGGSARNAVTSNEVADAGEGGVFLDGSAWREGGKGDDFHQADPSGRRPTGNAVTENWIHHCGLVYAHVAGVYLNYAVSTMVTHNLITDMPRYGISIKYNSPGNDLEYNKILRTNRETNDTGGIESYENPGPTFIRYNLVGDSMGLKPTPEGKIVSPYFCNGIYLDDHVSRVEIRGNLVYRQPWCGVMIHTGHDNVIENNVFVDSRDQQFTWSNYSGNSKGNRIQHNIVAWSNPASTLGLEEVPGPEWVDSDYNLYWPPGKQLDLSALVKKGLEAHSVIGDPLFVDAAHDDYRLRPGSPAEQIGFQPLPVDRMGPVGRFRGK